MALQKDEHPIHPIIIILFAILIFYIPFETMGMEESERTFTYSKIIGYIFFASCFILDRKRCLRFPPKAFWYFSLYLLIYSISGYFQEARYQADIFRNGKTLIQMLIFFWISFNILKFKAYSNIMVYSLAIACMLVSILQLTGISVSEFAGDVTRLSILKEDPNTAGSILALGAVCLTGIILKKEDLFSLQVGIYFLFLILIFLSLVKTGSRGALVSLIAGMVCYITASTGVRLKKMRYILLSLSLVILASWIAYNYVFMRVRIEETIYWGSFARREVIYPAALQMIIEKPILGWGAYTNLLELGWRTGGVFIRDTHNTFLLVLTEVGFLGAIPYFIGFYLCIKSSIKAKKTLLDPLPFSLVMTLLTVNLSLSWHNRKFYWFVLALALASGFLVDRISESTDPEPATSSSHFWGGNKPEKRSS